MGRGARPPVPVEKARARQIGGAAPDPMKPSGGLNPVRRPPVLRRRRMWKGLPFEDLARPLPGAGGADTMRWRRRSDEHFPRAADLGHTKHGRAGLFIWVTRPNTSTNRRTWLAKAPPLRTSLSCRGGWPAYRRRARERNFHAALKLSAASTTAENPARAHHRASARVNPRTGRDSYEDAGRPGPPRLRSGRRPAPGRRGRGFPPPRPGQRVFPAAQPRPGWRRTR